MQNASALTTLRIGGIERQNLLPEKNFWRSVLQFLAMTKHSLVVVGSLNLIKTYPLVDPFLRYEECLFSPLRAHLA